MCHPRFPEAAAAAQLHIDGKVLYAYAPKKPTSKADLQSDNAYVVPYRWVTATDVDEEANMKLVQCTKESLSGVKITFPVFQNQVRIEPLTQLKFKRAPVAAARQSLQGTKRIKLADSA